jgi:SPP1 family predicted phage head-tail adaptor
VITILFRDVVLLKGETIYTENDMGDTIENSPKPRQVFANKKSIGQSEFYQAAATGLKPEIKFEVRTIEYEGERILEFNNSNYTILRTYDKNGEITELICSGLVNGVS